jgi:hypothetical protein
MKYKLLFILFPGWGVIKKGWDAINYNPDTNEIEKNNFITELKKLGKLYFYEPQYHNIYHYDGIKGDDKWFDKNIDFTKDDLDIDKVCEKIYNDVKDFDGKLVMLGHSMGALFVYHFIQKYSSKCLFGIVIDGMFITSYSSIGFLHPEKYKMLIKKYTKYNDDDIKKLINKVKTGNKKALKDMDDLIFCNITKKPNYAKNIKKFNVPMISFFNYKADSTHKIGKKINETKINDINHIRKNNNEKDFKIITFINKTHFPHLVEESKNIILENIKLMIDKYN